jgi:hypothetical protein
MGSFIAGKYRTERTTGHRNPNVVVELVEENVTVDTPSPRLLVFSSTYRHSYQLKYRKQTA